jgi:hypothetical protein
VFWSPPQLLSDTFLVLRRTVWDDKKCILVFMESIHYSCQSLMTLQFSWQIFKKHSNIKFHENPFSGSWTVPCGWIDWQMDRHEKLISHFSHLSTCAWKSKDFFCWIMHWWEYGTDYILKHYIIMSEESNTAYSKKSASALAIYTDVWFCSFRIPGCKLLHF